MARDPAVDVARVQLDAEIFAMFMSHHWSKESFKPSTGGGLFDVDYDPRAGEMVATVRIAFKFTTGNLLDPTWFAAIGGLAAFAARGFKAEDFIWTDEEKTTWRTQAVSDIQSVWSERYTFFTKRPYWEGLPPVNVRVVIADAPETGDHDTKAQWVVTVNKWPDDANLEKVERLRPGRIAPAEQRLVERDGLLVARAAERDVVEIHRLVSRWLERQRGVQLSVRRPFRRFFLLPLLTQRSRPSGSLI